MTQRKIQQSVTVFLRYQDKFLILHRPDNGKVDSGRLNGIGGKVEPNETFVQAAIRETEEETGYIFKESEIEFSGLIRTHGGYSVDWVVAFFSAPVDDPKIPIGKNEPVGSFIWMTKEELLASNYVLVDDLHYLFKDVAANKKIFFADIQLNEKEKVKKINVSYLPKNLT